MTRPVRLSPSADADLIEIGAFLARESQDAADRFLQDAGRAMSSLSSNAERGASIRWESPRLEGVRWIPLTRFKRYLVFYQIRENDVLVFRILHGSRDLPAVLGRG